MKAFNVKKILKNLKSKQKIIIKRSQNEKKNVMLGKKFHI